MHLWTLKAKALNNLSSRQPTQYRITVSIQRALKRILPPSITGRIYLGIAYEVDAPPLLSPNGNLSDCT